MKNAIYFIADRYNVVVSDFYTSKENLLAEYSLDDGDTIVEVQEGSEDYEELRQYI